MKDEKMQKIEIQKEMGDLAEVLSRLTAKYEEEPLVEEVQKIFLSLSVHVCRALDIEV